MLGRVALAVCGLVAAVQAVVVPVGLAPGLYSIPFDANGTALSAPIPLDFHASSARLRRQSQNNPPLLAQAQTRCGSGGAITISEFSSAKSDLQKECDLGLSYQPRNAIVFTTGKAVAYFCSYDAVGSCTRREVEDTMSRIVRDCGNNRGGEVFIPQQQKSYGGDNTGQQICRF